MNLYLQYGWGMMQHCRVLVREWGGGTTILSPRDLWPDQIVEFSADLMGVGGTVLVDPQFYVPRSDHHRLTSHAYWPADYDTAGFGGGGRDVMIRDLAQLNVDLGTTHFIVPGERADVVDDSWIDAQRCLTESAESVTDRPLIATICLSGEAVGSREQISLVMEQVEEQRVLVSGCYLVLEPPGRGYFVDDPVWVANALDLVAGIRRLGAEVIVGYCNQQQLIMASAGATAIASGNWSNVRSFSPGRFSRDTRLVMRRPAVWYYCPQALSEYTLPYLDIGARHGLADGLRPIRTNTYVAPLFEATEPSSSGWRGPDAFRHYLLALSDQVEAATRDSFDKTVEAHRALLDSAEQILERFEGAGVLSDGRSFRPAINANRSALVALERGQGPTLRREWPGLIS